MHASSHPPPIATRAPHRQPDQAILDQAHRDGFLTIGARSPNRIRLRNAWAFHCERQQIPYVVIEQRRQYAQVELDLIFQRPRPGGSHSIYSTWHLADATVERIRAVLGEFSATRTHVAAGSVFSYAFNIPLDQAPFVAGRLAEIASEDITGGGQR